MDTNKIDVDKILKNPSLYAKNLSIKELEDLVLALRDQYYNSDIPLVPDVIYDQIEDVLRQRSPKSNVLVMIGAPVKEAVKLPFPLPSLNKAKAGEGTITKWAEKYSGPYIVAHKLDGISMMYYHKKGSAPQLFTRGNGLEGQNVTGILKYINMGELKIPKDLDLLVVRGEVVISKKVWDKYYAKDNPMARNYVSGLVNAKHPDVTDLRRVDFVSYQLMKPAMKPSEQYETLKEWGFNIAPYMDRDTISEAELIKDLNNSIEKGPYSIDGLVITQDVVNPLTTDNPKHSIAFKNSSETSQTKVLGVSWKASKRGLLKPKVLIEPVFLSGGLLSKATAHNAKYVVDNSIGEGALVTIVRSGEVIPYIVSVDKKAKTADLPEVEYEWAEGGIDIKLLEVTDEVHHSVLVHMAKTLNIENLGPGTLTKVIEKGFKTVVDLINMNYDDWLSIPSLGKNADKIWASMQKLITDGVWLSQLMDASNIFEHGIGQRKMQSVLDVYPNLLDMVDDDDLVQKLVEIKGVEVKTAGKIIDGLEEFKEFLDQVPQIRILDEDSESEADLDVETNSNLRDLRVVFTGIRDKQLEELITNSGGTVADLVSKSHKNQVVVAKDPDATSNKLKAARDLGIKIYSIAGFKKAYKITD